jgi:hypothetical protein
MRIDGHEEAKVGFRNWCELSFKKKKVSPKCLPAELPNVHHSYREHSNKNLTFFTLHSIQWLSENARLLGYGAV